MRRRSCFLVTPVLLLAAGCFGQKSYEARLDHTLKRLERTRTISKNLELPPKGEKRFTEQAIYVQPPKGEALSKTGQLPVPDGAFDLDASFADKGDSVLHVLARVKQPKKAPTKGQPAAPAAAPVARGDFVRDVLEVLTSQFGPVEAFANPKLVPETKAGNRFGRLLATANDKEMRVYTYKEGTTEAALIFVYDPKLRGGLDKKINLCLETFAAGPKATRIYNNGAEAEEDTGAATAAAPL